MPRATIHDVARQANLSVSTVNRVLHEPGKVREETIRMVMEAAEAVRFYGLASIRKSLRSSRPKVRVGIQLLQSSRNYYRELRAALIEAAKAAQNHEVIIQVEHVEDPSPQNVAQGLRHLANNSDVLGVVSTEHPLVTDAIEELNSRGIRTFALLSELSGRSPIGYIGYDYWKVGRTAGWAFAHICKSQGKIGILVGNHRYRCQENTDSGFRSYMREHGCGLEPLDAGSTFETDSIAQEQTERVLATVPDLAGVFVAGGGLPGACAALRASGRAKDIALIGLDYTDVTRAALLDGTINVLLTHPLNEVAEAAIAAMTRCVDAGPNHPPEAVTLPFEIFTPENV